MTLPVNAEVKGVAEDADGGVYVALLSTDAKGVTTGGLYVTRDGGKTWTQVGKDRVLAAPAGSGLVCSADAGKTWAKRCPAAP
ncbi:MAG: hypothetical protein E6G57_07340 [Actinobacteria bacterium]|nr:MAG: hypothetical protein E6G57_07340 [Actinomycetota bacterium]